MNSLVLNNLEGNSFNQVYTLLLSNPGESYEIDIARTIIPRSLEDKRKIMSQFMYAAFIGQGIYDIATNFSYWVPDPASCEPFSFQCSISNKEAFADLLYDFISGYFNYKNEKQADKLKARAEEFFSQTLKNERESICRGLLQPILDEVKTWKENQNVK